MKCRIVFLSIIASLLTIEAQANQMHNTDCMKNPFASGCRGISAKRSSLPAYMMLSSEAPFQDASLAGQQASESVRQQQQTQQQLSKIFASRSLPQFRLLDLLMGPQLEQHIKLLDEMLAAAGSKPMLFELCRVFTEAHFNQLNGQQQRASRGE